MLVNGESFACEACVKDHREDSCGHSGMDRRRIPVYAARFCGLVADVVTSDRLLIPVTPSKHQCRVCNKVFSRSTVLREHTRTHTGEKPFQCETCQRSFARKWDYVQHKKTHESEYKFKCGGQLDDGVSWGCGAGFHHKHDLQRHHKSARGQTCRRPFDVYEQKQQFEAAKGLTSLSALSQSANATLLRQIPTTTSMDEACSESSRDAGGTLTEGSDRISADQRQVQYEVASALAYTSVGNTHGVDDLLYFTHFFDQVQANTESRNSDVTAVAGSRDDFSLSDMDLDTVPVPGLASLTPEYSNTTITEGASLRSSGQCVSQSQEWISSHRGPILDLADPNRPSALPGSKINMNEHAIFRCSLCRKRFSHAYNLRSHLQTHSDERPFVCTICGKAFARRHDRKRHEGQHTGEKKFICRGNLCSGLEWGCGIRFARADAFGRHLRSEAGQICIQPLIEEEKAEMQNRAIIEQQQRQQQQQQEQQQQERQQQEQQQQQQSQFAQGELQPIPPSMMMDPYKDSDGFFLPAALFQQYPALQDIDWSLIEFSNEYDWIE